MKLKRYHVIVLREDGKQYQNRILDFLYVRKRMVILGFLAALLLIGNLAFLFLAARQGFLIAETRKAKADLTVAKESLSRVKDDLSVVERQLQGTEEKLYRLEHLAKEQNLSLPQLSLAGTGGGMSRNIVPKGSWDFEDPELRSIYQKIEDTKSYCNALVRETENLDSVLNPHLVSLSRKPSIWPVKGFLSSPYGGRPDPIHGAPSWHQGIDISAPRGTPVVATAEGIVASAGWMTGMGSTVVIQHGNGMVTLYGHLCEIKVSPGQKVKRWDVVGSVGATGRATGNHCHYEVHVNGRPTNPAHFMNY
ncbi:MAG TPA: M23 family metallopeptidase [Acidobacteriota bacterium]|nr:M23 family metallopeptidase [Acidobacteriota bacterium]HNT18436.1 M23 family metallopeptidase [Acidobacteriota bacterium]HPA26723.1 M23 family metallopeptidase [Acidobacteriota bacterium]HQO20242.1 M23 family metallopeptidase [Acidobacteriota bacterium]HQQ46915.1 M23 family metallopeptidase [Acidobacteriota bacterium]